MAATLVSSAPATGRQFRTRLAGGWLVTSFRAAPAAPAPHAEQRLRQALQQAAASPPM